MNKELKGTVQTETNDDMKTSNEIIKDIKEKPNQFTSVVGVSSNLYFLGMVNVS